MNSRPPAILDRWIAFYTLEPFGNEWRQSAGVALEIAKVRSTMVAKWGGEPTEHELGSFLPGDCDATTPVEKVLGADATEKTLAAMAGIRY